MERSTTCRIKGETAVVQKSCVRVWKGCWRDIRELLAPAGRKKAGLEKRPHESYQKKRGGGKTLLKGEKASHPFETRVKGITIEKVLLTKGKKSATSAGSPVFFKECHAN